jgi:hypothetical protein
MVAEHPPKPWLPPVAPLIVERRFREVAPYAAGGRRTVRMRSEVGKSVAAPCTGVVTFRGAVAGSPPLVTVRCADGLRATVQGVRATSGRGSAVERGLRLGSATGTSVGLSARRADGTYLDPLRLLGEARRHLPAPLLPRPARRSTKLGAPRPAHLPASAFAVPAGSDSVAGAGARSGHRSPAGPAAVSDFGSRATASADRAVDLPLTVAGASVLLAAAVAGGVARRKRGTDRARSSRRAELVGARR